VSRGTLVLLGSGEFTPAMDDVDRALLETLPRHARVAIVPTAAGLGDTPPWWIERGSEHFRALGAEPVPILVLNKRDAQDPKWSEAVSGVDWIYFSGGDPGHLVDSMEGTSLWTAVLARHRAGAMLAGSSGGAMMMGQTTFVPSDRGPDGFPRKVTTRPAMGLVKDVVVAPHFDILPEAMLSQWTKVVPAGHRLLGIDEDTALVQRDGSWDVKGRGRVLVFRTWEDRVVHPSGASVGDLALGSLP
jgi:cyanophycinase